MSGFASFLRIYSAVVLAAAVGLDAWHAHGLKTRLDAEAYASFGRALDQQYVLGMGLFLIGLRLAATRSRWHAAAGALMAFSTLAFCGDVYAGALGAWHPGIAPQGGSAHILAWLLVAVGEMRARPSAE